MYATLDRLKLLLASTIFRWLGFVLEILAALIIFFSSLIAVIERDSLTGGLAGLSVSFAMQVGFILAI